MLTLIQSSYFRDLLESFSYGVVIFNAKGEAYAVNAIATQLLERSAEECAGKSAAELFQRLEKSQSIQEMLLACKDNPSCPRAVETVLVTAEGDKFHLSVASSLLIENKKIFGILVSLHDNTHIYKLHEREKLIMEHNHRLQRERAESVLHLSRAMAHQIRNPVMSIGGFAKLLQRRVKNDELEEFASAILEGSQRLEDMVRAFTSFTGIKPGIVEPIEIDMLLRSAHESGQVLAAELEKGVTWHIESKKGSVMADPALVAQAFEILLRNSLEAMEAGGEIAIAAMTCVAPNEDACCFEILDAGGGISEEVMAYVFDPFFSTKADGTGMGLCTARRIAQELGGALILQNRNVLEPHAVKGVRAVLQLPLA